MPTPPYSFPCIPTICSPPMPTAPPSRPPICHCSTHSSSDKKPSNNHYASASPLTQVLRRSNRVTPQFWIIFAFCRLPTIFRYLLVRAFRSQRTCFIPCHCAAAVTSKFRCIRWARVILNLIPIPLPSRRKLFLFLP